MISGYKLQVIVTIVPAIILLVLYLWLRGRGVKDQALLLLCLGLASWTAAGALASPPFQEIAVLHLANWIVGSSSGKITLRCDEEMGDPSNTDTTECETSMKNLPGEERVEPGDVICRYRDRLTRITLAKEKAPKLEAKKRIIRKRSIKLKEEQPQNAPTICLKIQKKPPTLQTVAVFVVSPVNNILLGLAALYLARVRKFLMGRFRWSPEKYKTFIVLFGLLIVAASVFPLVLMLMPYSWLKWALTFHLGESIVTNLPVCGKLTAAMCADVLASCFCIMSLAIGVVFSLWDYGNKPLAVLGTIAFLFVIFRQPIVLLEGSFSSSELILFSAIGNASLGFILVTLAMAWGLSGKSRLKVEASKTTGILALVVDLRDSTAWVRAVRNNLMVADFLNSFRDWILSACRDTMLKYSEPLLVKFLGDGYLLVWEQDIRGTDLGDAVNTARALTEIYPSWKEHAEQSDNFLPGLPSAIGVGLDSGLALRLTYENGSYDFIGDSINCASKLQAEIQKLQNEEQKLPEGERTTGGVAISRNLYQLLKTEQRKLFRELETSKLACGTYVLMARTKT